LPLESPLREPIIGPDGQMSRRWKDYFANLDVGQVTSTTYEVEAKFQGDPPSYGSEVRRLKSADVRLAADITDLEARVKALEFLDT
jgi:hypothetical protein